MAVPPYILHIPEPCLEEWHEMRPDGDGRYCTHCAKTVTDFTHMTDAEIIAMLQSREGKLCGRVRNDQLNRPLLAEPAARSANKLRELLAAFLLLIGAGKSGAGPLPPVVATTQQPVNHGPYFEIAGDGDDTAHQTFLNGQVLDSVQHEAVSFAIVNNKTRKTNVQANVDGFFKIAASPGDVIYIQGLAYEGQTFVVRDANPKEY